MRARVLCGPDGGHAAPSRREKCTPAWLHTNALACCEASQIVPLERTRRFHGALAVTLRHVVLLASEAISLFTERQRC